MRLHIGEETEEPQGKKMRVVEEDSKPSPDTTPTGEEKKEDKDEAVSGEEISTKDVVGMLAFETPKTSNSSKRWKAAWVNQTTPVGSIIKRTPELDISSLGMTPSPMTAIKKTPVSTNHSDVVSRVSGSKRGGSPEVWSTIGDVLGKLQEEENMDVFSPPTTKAYRTPDAYSGESAVVVETLVAGHQTAQDFLSTPMVETMEEGTGKASQPSIEVGKKVVATQTLETLDEQTYVSTIIQETKTMKTETESLQEPVPTDEPASSKSTSSAEEQNLLGYLAHFFPFLILYRCFATLAGYDPLVLDSAIASLAVVYMISLVNQW